MTDGSTKYGLVAILGDDGQAQSFYEISIDELRDIQNGKIAVPGKLAAVVDKSLRDGDALKEKNGELKAILNDTLITLYPDEWHFDGTNIFVEDAVAKAIPGIA